MRSIQDRRYGYIFNAWSNGRRVFSGEPQTGRTYAAMREAAKSDPELRKRIQHYRYRVKEEFYDYGADPNALHNRIDDPELRPKIDELRARLLDQMRGSGDPLTADFARHLENLEG